MRESGGNTSAEKKASFNGPALRLCEAQRKNEGPKTSLRTEEGASNAYAHLTIRRYSFFSSTSVLVLVCCQRNGTSGCIANASACMSWRCSASPL